MLMVSPAAPWPATTGGLVRIEAVLRQMARHFDLTFVSPRRRDQRLADDVPARFLCPPIGDPGNARRLLAAVDPVRPYHASFYSRRAIRSLVRAELASGAYDLAYSHFIYGVQYFRRCAVPVVVDQQNVDRVYWSNKAEHSGFPLGAYAGWNARRTIAYETRVLPDIWAYVSVSDEDREQTRAYAGGVARHFWVAPNGVDTTRFSPGAARADSGVITLGYLGSMDLQMNVDAVERFSRELLPRIREELRGVDVRLLVIGREPSPALRALAAADDGITLSGTVDDVVPWLRRVDVLVAPLRIGAGTKLKVAEAMACALPVVGTPLAFAGLPGRSGEHYVRAESGDEFVAAVCRLARRSDARLEMGQRARELTRQHLEWNAIGDRLAADIQDGLARRVAGT